MLRMRLTKSVLSACAHHHHKSLNLSRLSLYGFCEHLAESRFGYGHTSGEHHHYL